MLVGVAIFELHIEAAQSLKDKRAVVRSLREKLRSRYEISVAEVGMNELHQRARLGLAMVSSDSTSIEKLLASAMQFVERSTDARLIGWNQELIELDAGSPLEMPHLSWDEQSMFEDEEDEENESGR
jgi:uncharacterized protein